MCTAKKFDVSRHITILHYNSANKLLLISYNNSDSINTVKSYTSVRLYVFTYKNVGFYTGKKSK
jgi:hypothetical protein